MSLFGFRFHLHCVLLVAMACASSSCALVSRRASKPNDDAGEHVQDAGARVADAASDARTIADGEIADAGDATVNASDAEVLLPDPTLTGFFDGYVQQGCEWMKRCWSVDRCDTQDVPVRHPRALQATVPPEVEGGRLSFDAHQAARCLSQHVSCGDGYPYDTPECQRIFRGMVKLGDDCYFPNVGSECAEGVCDACPGHCAIDSTPDQEGDGCSDNSCAAGLGCRLIDDARYGCVKIVEKGTKCSSRVQCETGLYCSDGECADRIATGAVCNYDFECERHHVCRYSDERQDLICVREVQLGESCKDPLSGCSEDSYCKVGGDGAAVCVPLSKLGEYCGAGPCEQGLLCTLFDGQLRCRPRSKLGEACLVGDCLVQLTCEDGVCTKGRSVGETCTSSAHCGQQLFCSSDGTCRKQALKWQACELDANSCAPMQGDCSRVNYQGAVSTECVPACTGPGTTTQYFD